jgi:CDP-diacylglycerol--serine O-phosphatidyltransferase
MAVKLVSLRVLKESGKQKLFLIPFVFTFANALLGFLAIINALDGKYIAAAYCIVLAAFMDMIDGRLARAFGSSSSLGRELDSLCDAVSFCLAPAVVVYSWQEADLGKPFLMVLILYLCSGLFRLAKFNISSSAQYLYFSGLPSPLAALFLASCVINGQALAASRLAFLVTGHGFIACIAIISWLMISTVRFPTFKHYRVRRMHLAYFAMAGAVLSIACLQGYAVMFIGIGTYIVSSALMTLLRFLLKQ